MKKTIFLSFIIFWLSSIYAQQLPQNNQFLVNKFSYIPAYAGFSGLAESFLGFRQQWLGIKGAPKQENFYLNLPINNNMGFGTTIIAEQVGSFANFYLSATYSYHIQFSEKVFLSVGLSPIYTRNQLDFSKIHSFGLNYDPALQNVNSLIFNTFDIGISTMFFANGFHFGLNVPRTIALKFPNKEGTANFNIQREYFALLSYRFKINSFTLEPIVNLHTADDWKLDFSTEFLVKYSKFWSSVGYNSLGNIKLSVGAIAKNIIVSYNYDLGITGISSASNGTHEIAIGIFLGTKKDKKFRPLATFFRPQNSLNKDIEKRITQLEANLQAEVDSRISEDNNIYKKIDSLAKICSRPSEKIDTTVQEPQWVDTIRSYAVKFGYMKSKVFASSFNELDKYVALLKKDPSLKIKILVHSNSIFADQYSKPLTQSRAQEVARYFFNKGISKDRVFYEGKGSSEPLVPDSDPNSMSINERVEFLFNKKVNL